MGDEALSCNTFRNVALVPLLGPLNGTTDPRLRTSMTGKALAVAATNNRWSRLCRTLLLLGTMLLCIVSVACGGGGRASKSAGNAADDAKAAHGFLAAIEGYRADVAATIDRAYSEAQSRQRECPEVTSSTTSNRRLQIRIAVVTEGITDTFVTSKRMPEYRELAAKLVRIPTENPDLRTVVEQAEIMAGEAEKLEAAEVDVCELLEQWRRTGWSTRFEQELNEMPFTIIGVSEEASATAKKRGLDAVPGLQKLGLTFEDAVTIASATGFF